MTATPVKRIEKDFFLKALYDEQLPLIFLRNRTEYVLRVVQPPKRMLFLQADRRIPGLGSLKKMCLLFEYHGRIITFTVDVGIIRDIRIIAAAPELLYKYLNPSDSPVLNPPDLKIQCTGGSQNKPFTGTVIDISASGLLFTCPNPELAPAPLPDIELAVTLRAPKRVVTAAVRIARRYNDGNTTYFSGEFLGIAPEDIRFLFEFMYGRPFSDEDVSFLTNHVPG
jgi:hypothetical protein